MPTTIQLPGYQFVYQSTLSNAGVVVFYILNNLVFKIRDDISTSEFDFEALWIEIEVLGQSNIYRVIYRHPHVNLAQFMNYLELTIQVIQRENKLCMLMGDFNIDLLNTASHIASDEFLNLLGSSFFHPLILQPTRITEQH